MHVWDRHDGSLVEQRRVIDGPIGDISYTPNGSGLVVGARSGVILQLGAEDLAAVAPGIDLGSSIRGVIQEEESPDGRRVLVLFNESTDLAMVDLTDGAVVYEADPGIALNWADFSPDGSLIAVAALTGEVGILDSATGLWLEPPTVAHDDITLRVSFAPDGSTFVTSGFDGRVILWDARSGERLAVVPGRLGVGAAAEFLPDGHTIIVVTTDGAVYTWDIRLEHSIEAACRRRRAQPHRGGMAKRVR